jgi:lysophospholipase L1-like esterase
MHRRNRHRLKLAGITAGLAGAVAVAAVVASLALATPTPPPPASDKAASYLASPKVKVEPSVIVAIGDSYTGGSNAGGSRGTPSNWVVAAANKLRKEGREIIEVERGLGGSGYVNRGPIGQVFGEMIPDNLHPETDVAVFFGSINDQAQPLDKIRTAADRAFTHAKKAAPNAKFVVVAPAWMTAEVPEDIVAIRDALKELAAKHKFAFVDPIEERWFQDRPDLIGQDSVHPTDAGHLFMAEKITPHLKAALPKS